MPHPPHLPSGRAPQTTEHHARAVVVGTGFGGGVAALRLAEAGVRTLVLERGGRWPTGPNARTFPRAEGLDARAGWLTDRSTTPGVFTRWKPYTGLVETLRGRGTAVNCAAGVGGGSLLSHGMTLQPEEEHFAQSLPDLADAYGELDRWAYPAVARMLRLAEIPDDVLAADAYRSSRLFLQAAEKAGLETFRLPVPVDWDYVRGELEGRYAPTYTTGDLAYGVNNGGKHSVDATYLAAAEATGRVTVESLHLVRDLELDARGRWLLHVDLLGTDGTVRERKRITADAVLLAAGSPGTTRLLVKARAKGLVPDLPDAVGTGWGTNGNRACAWVQMDDDPGRPQGGPSCVGGRDPRAPIPYTVVHAGSPILPPSPARMMALAGCGIVRPEGVWTYDLEADDAVLTWPRSAETEVAKLIGERMDAFAEAGGGFVADTSPAEPATWHPLGGVPFGGAVDRYGRVHGHRGLYVLDGSRIPGSTGACGPAMTIAALAEHSMAALVRTDLGEVF
ncbi:GMC oxidoreductase [Actinocorallia aurea]